jgi:hypothetical protein
MASARIIDSSLVAERTVSWARPASRRAFAQEATAAGVIPPSGVAPQRGRM